MLATPSAIQSLPFSESDVRGAVSQSAWDKALAYVRQGRVLSLKVKDKGEHLDGAVKGTAPKPYQVQVCAHPPEEEPDSGLEIEGSCTCPVGINCKHVAALLVYALSGRRVASFLSTKGLSSNKRRVGSCANRLGTGLRQGEQLGFAEEPPLIEWLGRFDSKGRTTRDLPYEVLYLVSSEGGPMPTARIRPLVVDRSPAQGGRRDEQPIRFHDISAKIGSWKVPQQDLSILSHLRDAARTVAGESGVFLLSGEAGAYLFECMVATGRCHWEGGQRTSLRPGPPREARPDWVVSPDGTQRLVLSVAGGGSALPFAPPWYADGETGECGVLHHELSERALRLLLEAPPLAPHHAAAAREALAARAGELPLPLPKVFPERRLRAAPAPHLHILTAPANVAGYKGGRYVSLDTDHVFARVVFDYEGFPVRPFLPGKEIRVAGEDSLTVVIRNASAEGRLARRLYDLGFADYPDAPGLSDERGKDADFVLAPEEIGEDVEGRLLPLLHRHLPALEAEGWRVTLDENLPVRLLHPEGDWLADVQQSSGEDWFGLSLGITVKGRQVDLLPILMDALNRSGGWAALRELDPGDVVFARVAEGERLALPAGRMRAVLETVADLINNESPGALRLPRSRAGLLAELEEAFGGQGLRWQGDEALRDLANRLRDFRILPRVAPPAGLRAELRPYQQQGLAWLNFLREQGFGGILADDMGLGKTVQALALLLLEQEGGRLNRPSLIVAPTSVLGNWQEQAARFAPSLRVLLLHGAARKADFEQIPAHDLVLTSYALLHRDEQVHLEQPYHVAILDEAQNLKNPETHLARIAGKLQTRFRLALTGTPMENHLGELWSLMNLLMPGLLGNRAQFRRVFQTPIEKRSEAAPRQALARRVSPFLLRRAKEQVAPELPPKTEIPHAITLEGTQRDLYETVRLTVHEKVRAALDAKGFNRSRIVILDALLKLRQVCCDPRLVKLAKAKSRAPSAKLARLTELLPELIEGGRRILLYSQFTSMLDLIEPVLAKLGIGFVKLTGSTKDRTTPISRFQAGEVPLFLLSLKAGGTGLNLTAADTVIHYDPWWNPAAENQATDRAHRIGQDKPVFVHKLIAAGTVEERIVAMQERKADLVQSLFDETGKAAMRFSGADVASLFAPLES